MNCKHCSILAISAMVVAGFVNHAHAQGVRLGNRLIPRSSIEFANDVGVRAHTHTQILIGPPGGRIGFFGGLGPGGGLTPAQLRQAYNLPSTGGSQIIAIVDAYDNPNALSDFNKFSTQYGLPAETSLSATTSTNKVFQVLYGNGSKPATDPTGGWELEEALDIEWAHAMAPNAKIVLVEAASTSFTDLLAAEDTATEYTDGNGWTVKQVSNSWGGSEFSGESVYDTHFSGSGPAYFVAAGDAGAGAEYPSTSPYVISAGGSSVATNNSGNFVSETGWRSGGGGPSSMEPRPAYQNGISGIVGSHRGTPDLSFDADPNTGVSVYDSFPYEGVSYTWAVIGGTSVASPSLAGIANLAASAHGSFPSGSQALLTTIYSNLGTVDFRDITSGNNGYAAGSGWDFVTGVGTCLGLGGLQSSGTPQLSITSISPGSATVGGPAFTLKVNGSGYVTGSIVDWNGTALATTYVSATQVTAFVPAADIATAGSASVTVANPGGVTSNPEAFTISAGNPVPTSVNLNPASVTGGVSSTGTVTISSAAPTGGLVVTLSTTNPASVPGNVTVAAGSTTATFTVTTSVVAATATPSIKATANGTSASGTLTVTAPNLVPTSVTLNPASVTGGVSSTGTVTISGVAPTGGLTVNLSTTNPATVPATVTVAAGSTTATFTVTTSVVSATATPSIKATANGTSASGTLTVTVVPLTPPVFESSVYVSPAMLNLGTSTTVHLTIYDAGGPLQSGVVDCDIYDANGNQVQQFSMTGQSFANKQVRSYSLTWTPASRGTYTVKVGVYGAGSTPLYYWNNSAATITVQ